MVSHLVSELRRAVEKWHRDGLASPEAVVVAGSGLSVDLPGRIAGPFPLAELLPFEIAAIVGHPLSWELVRRDEGPVTLYFRGRVHAYQGFTPPETCFAVRLARLLGAKTLVISNASGCLRSDASAGQLFLISDQINLTGMNPLCGDPPEDWGSRFPDMSTAYDRDLRDLARRRAEPLGVDLFEGIYAGLLGPSYETPAEIAMLRTMGADLVGMSTVLEVIAARHMGMRCLGISLATNLAAGVADSELNHEEVLEFGKAAGAAFGSLLGALLEDRALVDP